MNKFLGSLLTIITLINSVTKPTNEANQIALSGNKNIVKCPHMPPFAFINGSQCLNHYPCTVAKKYSTSLEDQYNYLLDKIKTNPNIKLELVEPNENGRRALRNSKIAECTLMNENTCGYILPVNNGKTLLSTQCILLSVMRAIDPVAACNYNNNDLYNKAKKIVSEIAKIRVEKDSLINEEDYEAQLLEKGRCLNQEDIKALSTHYKRPIYIYGLPLQPNMTNKGAKNPFYCALYFTISGKDLPENAKPIRLLYTYNNFKNFFFPRLNHCQAIVTKDEYTKTMAKNNPPTTTKNKNKKNNKNSHKA